MICRAENVLEVSGEIEARLEKNLESQRKDCGFYAKNPGRLRLKMTSSDLHFKKIILAAGSRTDWRGVHCL